MIFSSAWSCTEDSPPVPSQIDLSEDDLFWPLDDSVLSPDPRGGLHLANTESGVGPHEIKWIDYIIRNSEILMEDEITPTTISDEARPLLLF